MGALYCHIPFCVSRCEFCVYPVVTGLGQQAFAGYCDALVAELREHALQSYGRVVPLQSVYFGGGTPSLLSRDQWIQLLDDLWVIYPLSERAEVTVEALLGTLSAEKAAVLLSRRVNRISIGVQTSEREILGRVGRAVSAGDINVQLDEMVAELRGCGFENLNVDVIVGLPGETDAGIDRLLASTVRLAIPHISVYPLMLSSSSILYWRVLAEQVELDERDVRIERYRRAIEYLGSNGYCRTGIGHFALSPKVECMHHRAVWGGENVIGAGVGAQSFVDGTYTRNCGDFVRYLVDPADGRHKVALSKNDELRRFVFMQSSRRLSFEKTALYDRFGHDYRQFADSLLGRLAVGGFIDDCGERVVTTEWGTLNTTLMVDVLGFESKEYVERCLRRNSGE
jgi:oxygen-independent coproporphyrinogen III oxidase